MLSAVVVFVAIVASAFLPFIVNGEVGIVLSGHRCSPYCRPGHHRKEKKK